MNSSLPFPQPKALVGAPFVGTQLENSLDEVSCVKYFSESQNTVFSTRIYAHYHLNVWDHLDIFLAMLVKTNQFYVSDL